MTALALGSTVTVPAEQLQALLALMTDAAELRAREVADAYRRGYEAGVLDPERLRRTWETALAVTQDRLVLALQHDVGGDETVNEAIARRRHQLEVWVRTGRAEDYPYPRRVA